MTTSRLNLLWLITPWILLSGCIGGRSAQQQALNQKRTFLPLVQTAPALVATPRFAAVKIRPFRIMPPYAARNFIVRRADGEAVADFYNSWLIPPQELFRVETARYLEATKLFAAVHDLDCGTFAPLGLEGVVNELYLDYSEAMPAAVVTLRLLILDECSPHFNLRFTAERQARVPFDPQLKNGASLAFSQALTQTLAALAEQLAQATLTPAE